MLYSMTAFTRHSIEKPWGSLTVELRALNNRFFELDLRLPEVLREIETQFRAQAAHSLRRGKVECHFRLKTAEDAHQAFSINKNLVQQLANTNNEITTIFSSKLKTSLIEILNWPGVLLMNELDKEAIHQDALQLFAESLQDLLAMRRREGNALQQRLEEKLTEVLQEVTKIKARLPTVKAQLREKILARIAEFKLAIDPQRFEEEVLLVLQKMDVTEEVDRLEIHVNEVAQTLKTDGAVGRRLDFLMQELHREANTLGSKSVDAVVTHSAIHLKVLIEQMREQVQNVE